jgi:signal transduction histidine kinase/CheY-like chemotaxis protein
VTLVVLVPVVASAVALYVAVLCVRFARAHGWEDQRWFAAVAASGALYCVLEPFSCDAWGPGGLEKVVRLQVVAAGLHVFSWLRYSGATVKRPPTRLDRLAWALCLGSSALAAIPGALFTGEVGSHRFLHFDTVFYDAETTWLGGFSWVLFCFGLVVVSIRFVRASASGVSTASGLAFSSMVMVAFSVNDTLVGLRLVQTPYLLSAGFLVPIAVMGVTLTSRFVEEVGALHKLEESLEALIDERTQELIATQKALLQAEKLGALGQLAAGVAHEINNPAASVTANLRYLIDGVEHGAVPDDGIDALKESLSSMGRIAQVVRQLLITGRMAAGHQPELTTIGLHDVVEEGIRLARVRCGPASQVVNEVRSELKVRAQEQSLVQVFANLVSNALEAMPASRTDGRVTLWAEPSGDKIEVRIEDDGAGMSAETLNHLFEPFFSTKPFGKGTGLGLAVSKGLVAGLGGTLRFSSELGKGTTAHLVLERGTGEVAERVADAPLAPASGPPARLLLIDDDQAVREALRRELGQRFAITLAGGVNEAVSLLERDQAFDLVLCDLMMPDGGGEALWDQVSAKWPLLSKKVAFITGGASDERARAFLERQPQPVLNKPLEAARVIALVR